MAGPRKKRTVRNPGAKVTRRTANRHFKKVSIPNEDIKKLWDPKKTLLQNYQRLGIAGDPNAAVNKDLPENERPVSGHPEAAKIGSGSDGESQPTLIKEIEALGGPETKAVRHQSEGEKQFLERLIAKYGDDYERMARDIKLNRYQQTASDLRRRIQKYKKSLGSAGDDAMEE